MRRRLPLAGMLMAALLACALPTGQSWAQAPAPAPAPAPPAPAAPALPTPAPAAPALPAPAATPVPPPAAPAPASALGRAAAGQPAPPFAEVFSQLAGQLVGVVVNISTTQAIVPTPKGTAEAPPPSPGNSLDDLFRDFFGDKGGRAQWPAAIASLGSGFIVDPSGLIVTNAHVIANADQITVTLSDDTVAAGPGDRPRRGHRPGAAQGRGRRRRCRPRPGATRPRRKVGDWVLAIGNPFGLGGSVTAGIISATARDIHSGPV